LASLGWTGERYLPFTDSWITGAQIHYEHLHRYYFAAQLVDNKSVLDLGCGEGYGSFILSKHAQRVVGVDSADEAIEHARRTYARSNLEFLKASILSVPIEEEQSFDVVVCFEVLEHVAEHEDLLTEIKRLLKPDGLLIMSTPDKRSYSDEPKYENPYHRKELYFDQFRELVRRYFVNVDILGQRVYVGSHIWTLTRPDEMGGTSDEFVIKKSGNAYSRAEYEAKKPLYFVALASDAQLGDGIRPRSYLTDADNTAFDAQLELTNELNLPKTKLSQMDETVRVLESDLESAKLATTELNTIKESFGYQFIRFYAKRIDRLFPEKTARGEFRRIVTAGLRTWASQGAPSFLTQALAKIRRREFHILERPAQPGLPSDERLSQELNEFLFVDKKLEFLNCTSPLVSIVIVTYNKALYTLQCLRSLLADSLPSYEVIIVDNASSDETPALLSKLGNAIVIKNEENRFFAPACNQGGDKARGKYLLFLNADAFVHRGCVSSLTRTMESAPDIGAAGAKLVWRDGRLQEAGSIIWRDGSALGYGRGDDPSKPEYSYARDVDYCSAACLIVRRELFERLGGFDESFTPAYYEDTDLCMRIWDADYRVAYQPMAVATHIEFASSSFESASRLMEKQRLIFLAKHGKALERRPGPSENALIRARDRKSRPTILVIDDCVPKPEEGSGYPRMFLMLKSMASLGYRVTLLPLTDTTGKQPETHLLTQMGVEILWGAIEARQLLEDRRDSYDMVLISRPHNALLVMDLVRETNPKARVIYDAEALWHRREQLRRRLGFKTVDARFETEEAELSLIRSADYVTAVSPTEQKLIQEKLGDKERVILLGHPHHVAPTETPFENRHDLLFVAGFKSAPGPNDDAAIYFTEHLLPRIQEKIPDVRFVIAGSNPPESVKQLASDSVLVLGYVTNLNELYEKARVFVVPTRFAAGIMWKVTEAMSYGLPCVLSTVAAQGLEIRDGEEALRAVDDDDFVKKAARLYQDRALWTHIREHELEYVAKNCDPAAIEKKLGEFLDRVSASQTR